MKLEEIKLNKLKEYGRNARTHNADQVEQLKRSITEFGFTNPVLVDENNVLIAGHGRLLAARALAMESVPCIRLAGLTEAQKKALRIADNQLALNAGWDDELLKIELAELQDIDFNLDVIGFDAKEIDRLLDVDLNAKSENEVEETKEACGADLGFVVSIKISDIKRLQSFLEKLKSKIENEYGGVISVKSSVQE